MTSLDRDPLLFHFVRLQAEGRESAEIAAWYSRYGLQGDLSILTTQADELSDAERATMVRQSRKVTRQVSVGIAFGAAFPPFLAAWLLVGLVWVLPLGLGQALFGGTIGAGLMVARAVKTMATENKPVSVFVGALIGWMAFVFSYAVLVGDVGLLDILKALAVGLLSAGYGWWVKESLARDGGSQLLGFVALTGVYLCLVIAVGFV